MRMGKKIMSVAVAISVGKKPANTTVMIVPQTPLKSSWIIRILKTFLDMTSRSGLCRNQARNLAMAEIQPVPRVMLTSMM